ncbi:MAG: DsbA family protein [Alphaproteobacteria bacterium]|nr:DsbA family protein [Alphaproteobacteria bacterium]
MASMKNAVIAFAALAAVGIAASVFYNGKAVSTDSKSLTKEDVQGIIKEWILANPETIIESVNGMQKKQMEEQFGKAKENIAKKKDEIFNDAGSPVAGNPKGDVVLVEFFDYNCGYCKKAFTTVNKLIEDDKNLKVVFKEFPILSESSELAARAALAVYSLDKAKYFDYHAALMKFTGNKDEAKLLELAKDVGVDPDKLKAEMGKQEVKDAINRDRTLAQALMIRGTPAFIIGDELIPGAIEFDALKAKIAAVRGGAKPAEAPKEEEKKN